MNETLRRKIGSAALAAVSLITLTGFGCRSTATPDQTSRDLVEWGLWQDSDEMKPVIDAFTAQFGGTVTYKKVASVATYEQELVQALAEGRGPDVFVLHHTWIDPKQRLLSPAPASIVDERAVRDEFVDVVAADLIRDGNVYALPTSVDSLAMYYNKDIFNAAGIARPPRTWTDFQQMTERITKVSRVGTIEQSAAALGTAANVNRAPDILQVLLLQSGLPIVDPTRGNLVAIANEIGERALTFYTDFANKAKQVYTWNLQEDFSIDAFAEGEAAVMFNYSYHIPTVRAKNVRLNFGIAPLPQISDVEQGRRINFAAYWPYGVSSSSQYPSAAWAFVRFLTNKENAAAVNLAQGAPPARRDSVVDLQRDPTLGVFAEQSLSARTWPRIDMPATDAIFNTMIDTVVVGSASVTDSVRQAEDQLNKLYAPSNEAQ
jgi:multiple sugar transport system substrate-binding protein